MDQNSTDSLPIAETNERAYCPSPYGFWEIGATDKGICSVKLLAVPAGPHPPPTGLAAEAAKQLEAYFQRKRTAFDLLLDLSSGTPFNQAVWQELLKIPYGKTASYSGIAKRIGNPEAARAVGMANHHNPIAIIVPCHRCIAKGGDLHGYYHGTDMKRRLLELENPAVFGEQGKLF